MAASPVNALAVSKQMGPGFIVEIYRGTTSNDRVLLLRRPAWRLWGEGLSWLDWILFFLLRVISLI